MTKESGFGLPRAADCGKVSIWETNGRHRLVSEVCYVDYSRAIFRLIGSKVVFGDSPLSFLVERGEMH